MSENIIEVRNLTIKFPMKIGTVTAADSVDFDIPKGKITALVGESGSGKSTVATGILRAVSSPGIIESGSVYYKGKDLLKLSKEEFGEYRWSNLSMVFQAAQNALNPVMTIKEQIIETVLAHEPNMKENEIIKRASELLDYVRLDPSRVLGSYPHELSGGMKQRVMIAFSLLLSPELVILDEPTTALDVITQDYIFNILTKIHEEMGITMLLLTHDIGVVAKVADRIGVMYAGKIVEVGDVYTMFDDPKHPYTKKLINAAPSLVSKSIVLESLKGAPPNLLNLPSGCSFNPRCTYTKGICKEKKPNVHKLGENHIACCHKYDKEYSHIWIE